MKSIPRRCSKCLLAAAGLLALAGWCGVGGSEKGSGKAIAQGAPVPNDGTRTPPTSGFRPAAARIRVHGKPKPLSTGAVTSNWASFLGPNHNLTTPETKLLKKFPADGLKLVWEIETGSGFSAPAVSGDRVVFFHRLGDEEIVECLHRETAEHYWSFRYPSAYSDRYEFNNGPRSSPVIEGDLVFTHGVEGKLHCLDLTTGRVVWQRDTSKEHKITATYFGVGSTPLVDGDLLIVQVGAPPGGPCVVAYNKKTGDVVWQAGDQWQASYASPIPAVIHGTRRILVFAGGDIDPPTGGLLVIDPANGAIETRFPFRSRNYISVNAANPTVVGNSIFLSTSYKTGCVLLDLKEGGGHELAWKSKALEAHFATSIHVGGYLYGFDGGNKYRTGPTCVDVTTGKRVWQVFPDWSDPRDADKAGNKIPAGPYRGSMLYADGDFLILGEDGHLAWAELSPKGYKDITRTRLFNAAETWTPPVVSHGLLYVCQNSRDKKTGTPMRLLCYDLRDDR
ncbi:MAG: PQQ-like beta-propeller repeat protein [Planctomycetes bacterium]|nr:PQQ-like beta-propeller repeat protein [Planctomycetota bacterium]